MFAAHGVELPEIDYDGTMGSTKQAFVAFRGLYAVRDKKRPVRPMDVIESRDPITKRVHLTVALSSREGITVDDVAGVYVLSIDSAKYGLGVKVLRYVGPGSNRLQD